MRSSRFPLIGLVGLFLTVGSVCSSLLASERFDPIEVTTLPAGATVIVDGERLQGRTPIILNLSRQLVHSIRVELEGYHPRAAEVRPEVDWSEISNNVLSGPLLGVVGSAVELSTGDASRLTPAQIQWTLEQVSEVESRILPMVASRLSGL